MAIEINITVEKGKVVLTRTEGELDDATLAGVLRHVADQYDPPAQTPFYIDSQIVHPEEDFSYLLN